jgi:hypothetical protein
MQTCILLYTVSLYQLNESSKGALGMHHLEYLVIFAIATII